MRAFPLAILAIAAAAVASTPLAASQAPTSSLPPSLAHADPHTLSAGLYLSLALDGHFGGIVHPAAPLAAAGGTNKGVPPLHLDARVGDNIRLGNDPAVLPSVQNNQAEPHLWRSAANPELLVGTFQEGRFAVGGGALDTGTAISSDGGITWRRALLPNVTTASGGTYLRATDPVAAVDLNGNIFISTLVARQSSFNDGGVMVVCRSTDGGATFAAPVTIASGNAVHALDKDWMAVNDYSGTAHANRLVVTYTNIYSTNNIDVFYDLYSSVSDNAGATWSTPILIKAHDSLVNQATQVFFLPDGSLFVAYITNYDNGAFRIECKRSTDGGTTYPSTPTVVVSRVSEWVDPALRSGTFLITAWVARQSGAIYITYAARDTLGNPRVFVTRSTNQGTTWSTPVVASDNPAGDSVVNPAVAATPDGSQVSVAYYDKRTGVPGTIDLYSNTSYDGGVTWQSGVRLTEYASDYTRAPLTSQGYMLGDYQGLVPPYSSDQPGIALTMDTREGNTDPYAIRYTWRTSQDYLAWQVARFNRTELADDSRTGPTADFDGDGICNAAEYFHQTNPRVADRGSLYATSVSSGSFVARYQYRIGPPTFGVGWETSTDGANWTDTVGVDANPPGDVILRNEDQHAELHFVLAGTGPTYFREKFSWSSGTGVLTAAGETLVAHSDARLVNVSTRGQVKTGESQLIVGFVTTGGAKSILVRGVGPTLGPLGVPNPLPDPQLTLVAPNNSTFTPVSNDNWSQGTATAALFSRLGAQPLPDGSLDSAIVQTLDPRPYSALLSDTQGRTGLALVEAYDADATPGAPTGPHLVNLSSRGEVGTGDNLLIGGFVITGTSPKRILLRAVGPTLADQGVTHPLSDPILTLHRLVQGADWTVGSNDDWENSPNATAIADTAQRIGAFALRINSTDAALLLTLDPGIYSATVSGVNNGTGVALVEIYDAD